MELTQIKFQDASTKTYLGSPSIIRLDNGDLLVTHDYFGPGAPVNHEGEEHLTSVYRSSDGGQTWVNVTHIAGAFWSSLFTHRGSVYLLGTSQQYGSIVIRRSEDNGDTWSHSTDETTGLLFKGGPRRQPPNYHCAPVPVLRTGGRIYRAFEDCDPCVWPSGFKAAVISADEDADLLHASSWRMSNKLSYNKAWTPKSWGPLDRPGWLEGNVIELSDGEIWNLLRFNSSPLADKAAAVNVSDEGRSIAFDPVQGFIHLPGGMSKFTIRRDPISGVYLTVSNNNTDPGCPRQRNVLSLHSSEDLIHWRHNKTLLEDDSGLSHEDSVLLTGFQYADWQFDRQDIVCAVRTAYLGAHSFHDANRITFHRIRDFRHLL